MAEPFDTGVLSTLSQEQKNAVLGLIAAARDETRKQVQEDLERVGEDRKQYYLSISKDILNENKRFLPVSERQITSEELITLANSLSGGLFTPSTPG